MEGKDTQREVEVSAANSSQMKEGVGWMSGVWRWGMAEVGTSIISTSH